MRPTWKGKLEEHNLGKVVFHSSTWALLGLCHAPVGSPTETIIFVLTKTSILKMIVTVLRKLKHCMVVPGRQTRER